MPDFQLPAPPLPTALPADLLAQAQTVDLARGEHLFRQGDAMYHVAFVLEGEMKAVRHLPDGVECVMLRARAGELFAESGMADNQYRCDGIAVGAVRLAMLPVKALRAALGGEDSLAYGFCMAVARQARKQCSRQERLRLKRARDRVLHFLACEGGGEGVVQWSAHLSELAAELGLERETLYRTLAALDAEGLLRRTENQLRLLSGTD
ncbi:MAG: Crp/Fnr family transcriptional regulator [Pseudomonadota bacterium]|nr:Crp/Fnr family transcriptional regulator [Pseudomonadota bacterium]